MQNQQENKNKVLLLFYGNFDHQNDFASHNSRKKETRPHVNQIVFANFVRIHQFRFLRPKSTLNVPSFQSITQTKLIKSLEIYYKNMNVQSARYQLFCKINQLQPIINSDIIINSKEGICTNILVFRGFFSKISICIYGQLIPSTQQSLQKQLLPSEMIIQQQTTKEVRSRIHNFRNKKLQNDKLFKQKKQSFQQIVTIILSNPKKQFYKQIKNINIIARNIGKLLQLQDKSIAIVNFVVEELNSLHNIILQICKQKSSFYLPVNIMNQIDNQLIKNLLECFEFDLNVKYRIMNILIYLLQNKSLTRCFMILKGEQKIAKLFIKNEFKYIRVCCLRVLHVLSKFQFYKQRFIDNKYVYRGKRINKLFQIIQEQQKVLDKIKQKGKDKILEKQKRKHRKNKQKKKRKHRQRSRSRSISSSRSSSSSGSRYNSSSNSRSKSRSRSRQHSQSHSSNVKSLEQNNQKQNINDTSTVMIYRTLYQILLISFTKKDLEYEGFLLKEIINNITKNFIQNIQYNPILLKLQSEEIISFFPINLYSMRDKFIKTILSKQVEDNHKRLNQYQSLDIITQNIYKNIPGQTLKLLNLIYRKIITNKLDARFIQAVSQLIHSKQNIKLGINIFIPFLKVNHINELKKKEAAYTIFYEYIYNVLIHDEGILSFVHIQQLFVSLTQISIVLRNNPNVLSKEFAVNARFLSNFVSIYENLQKKPILAIFKILSERFLRLISFKDIKNTNDHQKYLQKFKNQNLVTTFNLGNFFQLLPHQPLLQIDIILKFFLTFTNVNHSLWMYLYNLKTTVGVCVLLKRLSHLLIYLLQKNINQQFLSITMEHFNNIIDNYFSVLTKLLKIRLQLTKIQNCSPQDVTHLDMQQNQIRDQYQKLYECLFNVYKDQQNLIYKNNKEKILSILEIITEIFYYYYENLQYTKNGLFQRKLNNHLVNLYSLHFSKISSRVFVLNMFTILYSFQLKVTNEIINSFLLVQNKIDIGFDYVKTNNSSSVLEALLKYNIYRNDTEIKNSLRSLVLKIFSQKKREKDILTFKILNKLLSDLCDEIKKPPKNILLLQKILIIFQFYRSILSPHIKHILLHSQLQDIFIKVLKGLEEDITRCTDNYNFNDLKYFHKLFQCRNTLLSLCDYFYNPAISELPEKITLNYDIPSVYMFKQLAKIINKIMTFSPILRYKLINQQYFQQMQEDSLLSESSYQNKEQEIMNRLYTDQTIDLSLKSFQLCIRICINCSKNLVTQNILLYRDIRQNIYKNAPAINLKSIFNLIFSLESKQKIRNGKFKEKLLQIFEHAIFLLINLTQNPVTNSPFYNHKRKIAITSLITQRSTPIDQIQQSKVIRKQYIFYLVNYYNHPDQYIMREIKQQIDDNKQREKEKFKKKDINDLYKDKSKAERKKDPYLNYSKTVKSIVLKGETMKKNKLRLFLDDFQGESISSKHIKRQYIIVKNLLLQIFQNIKVKNNFYTFNIPQFVIDVNSSKIERSPNQCMTLTLKRDYSNLPKKASKPHEIQFFPKNNVILSNNTDKFIQKFSSQYMPYQQQYEGPLHHIQEEVPEIILQGQKQANIDEQKIQIQQVKQKN